MKKLIYCALALAAGLFATSCMQENLEPVAQGNTVTFTVEVPEIATKGLGDNVSNINDLVYAVYYTAANSLEEVQNGTTYELLYQKNYTVNPFNGNRSATVPIEVVNDKNYFVIFWAQHSDTWVQGESFDLRSIDCKSYVPANDNNLAAFSGIAFLHKDNLAAKKNIVLKRPFAQINIGTLLATEFTLELTHSAVTVAKAGSKFNLIKQEAEGEANVVFTSANVPTNPDRQDGKLAVNNIEYTYAAMNYIFANGNVDVTYTLTTANHGEVSNTVSNVPVAANYRTNIVGRLLTSTADYTVVLDEFDTNANSGTSEVIVEGLVKNQKGDYEISTDNGLIHAINNLWVDEDGVADQATFYVYPKEYNITDDQIRDVVVTSGTLKVIQDKPVMTRSIGIDGIVIKGLSKPLIASVEEDATVVISGVTIQTSEDNDEQVAALIGVNNGKVIIENCNVIDENDDPDTTTELIGDNNGTVTGPENVDEGEVGVVYDAVQLAAAFANAEIQNIVLGANIAVEETLIFPEGRTATLDLKGYELTIAGNEEKVSATYAINNHGTLTIKDSYGIGAVNARGIYNGYVAGGENISTATLTIKGGTFNALGTNGGAAVYNYGVVVIEGGNFKSNGGYCLNNQTGATMAVTSADVCGGIYNCGTVTVNSSKVYQHLSGKHAIYNWSGSVTINGGEFDSESGNELIFADGQHASVVIEGGEFHKTAKSWLYAAATGKDITFTITGGTHYGYVNEPEMTVDTFRPYGDPIVVTGGSYNFDVTKWCAKDYKAVKNGDKWYVVASATDAIASSSAELESLVNNATKDITVSLAADLEDNITIIQKQGVKITIDGNGKKYKGSIKVHSNSYHYADAALTIKNVNFETSVASLNFIEALENGAKRYSTNITADNCTFTATGDAVNTAVGLQIKASKWAKVLNCTATNMHSLIQAQSCDETVVVNGCTINGKNGVAFKQVKAATVEGTTITALEYGIRFDGNTDNYGITVKNNNVTAVQPFIVRKMTGKNNTITLEGTNTLTSKDEDPYQIVITNGSDDAEYVEPTGTYTLRGAEGYIVYPNTIYCSTAITDKNAVRYVGDAFESGPMDNALWINNYVFDEAAAIVVENKTYNAIIIENCSGNLKNDVLTIKNNNSSVLILQNLDLTLAEGKKLIKTANPYYQVFMENITINGEKMTQASIAEYLENVVWYQVVEEI